MFSQFETLIRDIDRQIEAKQERLVEQREALADIQAGLDRLQRALAAEPAEAAQARRSTKAPDLSAVASALPQEAPRGSNGMSEPAPTGETRVCAAPGCDQTFEPKAGGPGARRKFCSAACRVWTNSRRARGRALNGANDPMTTIRSWTDDQA